MRVKVYLQAGGPGNGFRLGAFSSPAPSGESSLTSPGTKNPGHVMRIIEGGPVLVMSWPLGCWSTRYGSLWTI